MFDYEMIFWIVVGVVSLALMIGCLLPWNDQYDPNGDDPYRYCPKENKKKT